MPKLRAAGYSEEFIASLPRSTAREVMSFVETASAPSSASGTVVWSDYGREPSTVKLNSQWSNLAEYGYLSAQTKTLRAAAELAVRNSQQFKEKN